LTQQVFERIQPAPPKLTAFDQVSLISYRLFKGPAGRIAKAMPRLRIELLKSNMRITPTGLVSFALFVTLITGIIDIGIVIVAEVVRFPLLLFATPLPLVTFFITLSTPKLSQANRSSALDNELPFLVGYMSILAGGGLSLIDTLRRVSELKVFPASSAEAKRILVEVDVFGKDPITAVDEASKYSPSKAFSELLAGYTTVLKTGGDYVNYLNLRLRETFTTMSDKIRRTVDTIGLIAESFLIVTVVLGVTLFTLYLVETVINGNAGAITNIYFFSYVIVPVLTAGFAWVIDSVQPKWPFNDFRPYRYFFISLPIGLILFVLPLPLASYAHMGLALLVISVPPAIFASRYSRERRDIERMLPEFISDVSEGRKIGLPPEASIERLVDRNYGTLTTYVAKMGSQLSWGVPLTKVIGSFSKDVKSWMAKAVGTLMLQVVEVGGGTLKGFAEMADFTRNVSRTEAEGRSILRHYVLIAYIGALMLVATTFMMILLLSQQAALGVHTTAVHAASPAVIDDLLTAGMFESWVIGMFAGKMGEGSISEGFRHGVILVALNLIAIVVIGHFIKI
jgi:archaeal flagellar protein FlaJ